MLRRQTTLAFYAGSILVATFSLMNGDLARGVPCTQIIPYIASAVLSHLSFCANHDVSLRKVGGQSKSLVVSREANSLEIEQTSSHHG